MKILYVTTIGGTMSFFVEHFKMLLKEGHSIELACNLSSPVRKTILDLGVKVHNISFSRSPFSKDNIRGYKELKKIIHNEQYDIVHCHTPNAAAITRLVCKGFRKKGLKVFYTAHGFHFYKGAPLKNWLIYYPIEWICAHWTDTLITINREDYALASKRMKAGHIEYVPGIGIDLERINKIKVKKESKLKELSINSEQTVILSVGELNENKNHATVIKALGELKKEGKLGEIKYLICGQGSKYEDLKILVSEYDLENTVDLLGFRDDVLEIYQVVNFFVFPSFREGLSVSVMEAMASGLPVICSRIRGNVDLVDKQGGSLFNPYKEDDIKESIYKITTMDEENILSMKEYNREKIRKFAKCNILKMLHKIYLS